jgi:hypothetical protein
MEALLNRELARLKNGLDIKEIEFQGFIRLPGTPGEATLPTFKLENVLTIRVRQEKIATCDPATQPCATPPPGLQPAHIPAE